MSASKPARTGRDLARDFAILISEFSMHDLMLRARRMLQEKLKFGAQPTFDRTGLGNPQRLRKFLEANGARISIPNDHNFETEGEAIESGLRRTVESRDMVMRSLVRAVYRFLCGNCRRSRKFFAVRYGYNKGDNELVAVKLGEHPPLSLQIPSRLRKLFGTDQEKFNKALRSEAYGLGVPLWAHAGFAGRMVETYAPSAKPKTGYLGFQFAKWEMRFRASLRRRTSHFWLLSFRSFD
jgi:hypothetical protein